MWALFLAIGGIIVSIFYGFFWIMKFCFMVVYKIMFTILSLTKDVVMYILHKPFGWAILAGLLVVFLIMRSCT